jgi:hypothetical protein
VDKCKSLGGGGGGGPALDPAPASAPDVAGIIHDVAGMLHDMPAPVPAPTPGSGPGPGPVAALVAELLVWRCCLTPA